MTTTENMQVDTVPRAVIHKQILDAANAQPDASLEDLATDIPGATVELVDRVLDEYGDPGQEPLEISSTHTTPESSTPTHNSLENITEKQQETLRLIFQHPTASQREIADMLDVTHTTVYHRLQAIEGFTWTDRWAFVTALFEQSDYEYEELADQIMDRLAQSTFSDNDHSNGTLSITAHPRLTAKVLQACLKADTISDAEFRLIIENLVQWSSTTE